MNYGFTLPGQKNKPPLTIKYDLDDYVITDYDMRIPTNKRQSNLKNDILPNESRIFQLTDNFDSDMM